MRRRVSMSVGALAALALVAGSVSPAQALEDSWAQWGAIEGTSRDYTTTMTPQTAGFPAASVHTDSRGTIQTPSGASSYLDASTPVGAKYGSSQNSPYLNLRPLADNASSPSTTTYTFDAPTPDTGWAFVLGDIDADMVRISATDATGTAVSPATIDSWRPADRPSFNYAGATDAPTWDATTATLTGNAGAIDTNGASAWFEPTTRLTSLTFTFTQRSGFPVYQTWFVTRGRSIGGTITDVSAGGVSCPADQSIVTLYSPTGEELATTSPVPTDEPGVYAYTFAEEYATQAGYTVRITAPSSPAECAVIGEAQAVVDNRGSAPQTCRIRTSPSPGTARSAAS